VLLYYTVASGLAQLALGEKKTKGEENQL